MVAMAARQAEFSPFRRHVCSAQCRFQPLRQVAPTETCAFAGKVIAASISYNYGRLPEAKSWSFDNERRKQQQTE